MGSSASIVAQEGDQQLVESLDNNVVKQSPEDADTTTPLPRGNPAPQSIVSNAIKQEGEELPPIRLIDFDHFANRTSFPRYPDNRDLCTTLDTIDRNISLIIFISHCWMRGWPGADGWDGRPHPDNATHDKFKLTIEGIKRIKSSLAPGMQKVYVWLDFGCMDQDGNPAGELKQLDEIIRNSDLMFTPIFDKDPDAWNYPDGGWSNYYLQYLAPNWSGEQYGYVNRGWCRVEMFYAANIPTNNTSERINNFSAGLRYHASNGVRPHVLYGSKDSLNRNLPQMLPPLQNSYFTQLHPAKGHVTVSSDIQVIEALVENLLPYMKFVEQGYDGYKNISGERHGHGVMSFANGDKYDGQWSHNKKHGTGVFFYASGSRYEGEWIDDKRQGHGIFYYSDGNQYDGEWLNDLRHGKGIFLFGQENKYVGSWEHDIRQGQGTFLWANGDRYEGNWQNNQRYGHGIFFWASGSRYEGEWKDDRMHGRGVVIHADGNRSEGEWNDGKQVS